MPEENKELTVSSRETAARIAALFGALAEGKIIESMEPDGRWVQFVGNLNHFCAFPNIFRVKPDPVFRTWTIDEIPVGAVIRKIHETRKRAAVIIATGVTRGYTDRGLNPDWIPYASICPKMLMQITVPDLMKHWEYKWAHEDDKAWRKCGVQE